MKPSVDVSVIIPVYNCEPYIEATLISLLGQTDKNFEIILIDDCSTDQSVRIIHRFIESNPALALKLILNSKNEGEGTSRNTGIRVACGDYICFLDSDDEYLARFIELMKSEIQKDFDFVYCGFDIITLSGEIQPFSAKRKYLNESDEIIRQYLRAENHFSHVAAMYRRNFLENHHLLYDESGRYGIDIEFICNLLLQNPRCSCVKSSLYRYRLRPNSITTRIIEKNVLDCLLSLNRIQDKIPSLYGRSIFFLTRKANMAYHLVEEFYLQELNGTLPVYTRLQLTTLYCIYMVRSRFKRLTPYSLKILFHFHLNQIKNGIA